MSNPPSVHPAHPAPLLVACLCAGWCGLCRDYRAVFDAAAAASPPGDRFVWVDIEDDEAVLGPVDVDDFPTLLIARGDKALFFGPVTPQPGTLARLLQSAQADELGRIGDAEITELVARVGDCAR